MPEFQKKAPSAVKVRKREVPAGLWLKCPGCEEIIYKTELQQALGVCPKCDYHFQLTRQERIATLTAVPSEAAVPIDVTTKVVIPHAVAMAVA